MDQPCGRGGAASTRPAGLVRVHRPTHRRPLVLRNPYALGRGAFKAPVALRSRHNPQTLSCLLKRHRGYFGAGLQAPTHLE